MTVSPKQTLEHFTVKLDQFDVGIMRQTKESRASTAIQHERKPL